jgi:chorismate mutase / prephenate dehydratase
MKPSERTLEQLRNEIDTVDRELLAALNRRALLAGEVGELKRREGSAVYRPEREAQVIRQLQELNGGPLKEENISHIWREVMSACRSLEAPQRVAVLGPSGTFCEEAALQFFGASVELIYCANFDQVFQSTAAGSAHFGVVGVENSTEGPVTRSLDLMLQTPANIVGEVSLMVRHHLLRKQQGLEDIEVVAAHPQALAQCQEWLSKHLPNAERRPVASNAEGARLAAENANWAALSGERSASIFGLHIVSHAIQDDAYNRTRFCIIALPDTIPTPNPSGKDCTSLIVSVPNKPGAVHDLLVPLKNHGVSMTRFESRPARTGQWEYYFYIDLQGHAQQPHVAAALAELRTLCAYFKLLGSYPASA